jgi:hypothetical protein
MLTSHSYSQLFNHFFLLLSDKTIRAFQNSISCTIIFKNWFGGKSGKNFPGVLGPDITPLRQVSGLLTSLKCQEYFLGEASWKLFEVTYFFPLVYRSLLTPGGFRIKGRYEENENSSFAIIFYILCWEPVVLKNIWYIIGSIS